MTIIEQVYASAGPDVIIIALELTCPAWAEPIRICSGFADPIRIKQQAFGLSIATAALAGALLIVIGPVEPSMNRLYIGRVFAIVVLGGMGSIGGTLVAALILGVAESLVATFYGPSWAPAVAFGILLITLALRPQGLFGRY
jgi:branched-chain amino acid transport system permease protein